ncbi:MAG: hypothetical protein AAF211_04035 [Myxococcota bacterium]
MSRLSWMLSLLVACGGDPHEGFLTPEGAVEVGAVWDGEGPLDNLMLNPNFTLPLFVNGVGVNTFDWDVLHDVDTPNGQPALSARFGSSLLFRMVRSPMTAEVWISAPPDLEESGVSILFTDPDTLGDREVDLVPVEERIIGNRTWTFYTGDIPAGDGHGLMLISGTLGEDPRVCAPVVRPTDAYDGLRSALIPSRPADPERREIYRAHRPTEMGPQR